MWSTWAPTWQDESSLSTSVVTTSAAAAAALDNRSGSESGTLAPPGARGPRPTWTLPRTVDVTGWAGTLAV